MQYILIIILFRPVLSPSHPRHLPSSLKISSPHSWLFGLLWDPLGAQPGLTLWPQLWNCPLEPGEFTSVYITEGSDAIPPFYILSATNSSPIKALNPSPTHGWLLAWTISCWPSASSSAALVDGCLSHVLPRRWLSRQVLFPLSQLLQGFHALLWQCFLSLRGVE